MKRLQTFHDETDANHLAKFLEEKGIVAHVSSKHSRALSSRKTGALTSEVWIPLDSQFDDARMLLQNRKHKVSNPLSVEEIAKLKTMASDALVSGVKGGITRFLNYLMGTVLVVILGVVVYSIWKTA
jgi:hypothetical protein